MEGPTWSPNPNPNPHWMEGPAWSRGWQKSITSSTVARSPRIRTRDRILRCVLLLPFDPPKAFWIVTSTSIGTVPVEVGSRLRQKDRRLDEISASPPELSTARGGGDVALLLLASSSARCCRLAAA